MGKRAFVLILTGCIAIAACAAPARAVDDDDVRRAIEQAKEHLINRQDGLGRWPERGYHRGISTGHTAMALLTLVFVGVHPNRGAVAKGLEQIMMEPDQYSYVTGLHVMALSRVLMQYQLVKENRTKLRLALVRKTMWLVQAQGSHGGWDYLSLGGSNARYDLSNTQLAILALGEAAQAGVEIPPHVWQRSQRLYFELQQASGAWNYGMHNAGIGNDTPGYGSMTAAGLASIYICWDNLTRGEGCPCLRGRSSRTNDDTARRIDLALDWLDKNFIPSGNPNSPRNQDWHHFYWLYSAERVGIAAGYKYFGRHDWFREGAEYLVKEQRGGAWGDIPDTCFATMFLYKGRAPILYNKVRHRGEWQNHRRDIANLVRYISKQAQETPFQWQIVELERETVESLHDAPILYITAETPCDFNDDEKAKLRRFTDTGGTVLLEASCGAPKARQYLRALISELWPEWDLQPLGSDHGVYLDLYRLTRRPELMGLHDGHRTFLFYAMDDISCPWHTKAFASKQYMFNWGYNMVRHATDGAPLRARLHVRRPEEDRFTSPVSAGPKSSLRLARVRHSGDWDVGRNYRVFEPLVEYLRERAGVSLDVAEEGAAAANLTAYDIAWLGGSKEFTLTEAEQAALAAYVKAGGQLWIEAAGGSAAFDASVLALVHEMGWQMEVLPKTAPVITGRMGAALGHDLSHGLRFSRTLRTVKLGSRAFADLQVIRDASGRRVGLYSPLDVLFSTTGYEAYGRHGYRAPDALAAGTNLVLALSTPEGSR